MPTAGDIRHRQREKRFAAFCTWHHHMVRHGVFSPCDCEHCPFEGADFDNPNSLILQDGVSLGDLIDFLGLAHWDLVANDPRTIRDTLHQIQGCKQALIGPLPNLSPDQSLLPMDAFVSHNLSEAARAQVETLSSILGFFGSPQEVVQKGLTELLTQLMPAYAMQGLTLCALLRAHFYGLNCLGQIRLLGVEPDAIVENIRTIGHQRRQMAEAGAELLSLAQRALDSMDLAMEYLQEMGDLLDENWRGIAAMSRLSQQMGERDEDLLITAATTEQSAEILYISFLNALQRIFPLQDYETGVRQILLNEPPREPLEAIVRLELLLCHFMAIRLAGSNWYMEPSKVREKERLMVRYQRATKERERILKRWLGSYQQGTGESTQF